MKQDLGELLQVFDDLAPFALAFESFILLAGSVLLTLALRAL